MKNFPSYQIYLNFFIVILAFSQAYNNWGERELSAYFFLLGGLVILALTLIILYKKSKSKDDIMDN